MESELNNNRVNPDFIPADLDEMVPKDDDRGVVAEFFIDKVHMGFKSREAGYPIHEDRPFIRIRVKGNDKTETVREVQEPDKRRFPHQWKAFCEGQTQ